MTILEDGDPFLFGSLKLFLGCIKQMLSLVKLLDFKKTICKTRFLKYSKQISASDHSFQTLHY